MEAGYNTYFQKVFDLFLQVEVAGNLDKDKMIEKVFVFSDMEFDNDGGRVAELQWKRIVDDLSEKDKLHNCIVVCDISGSMSGEPMEVCVALALLLSELSEHPWNGQVITFSENLKLHKIEGGNLRSKTQFIRRMEAGYNTYFQKVFDLLLQVEVAGNLDKDKMIEKVFVFSDMEFDNVRRPYGGCGG
ncbi:hypothetical protein IFM89_018523 [Coptis chinensis]|uniref:DUF7788 domain-containing protein n=1 Tax=Coptis chinensis TaxID=261450 RepID=A0A835HW34_9MAGN|nr:hypothetical protein IFM89_018523 [Coptis chinensis]